MSGHDLSALAIAFGSRFIHQPAHWPGFHQGSGFRCTYPWWGCPAWISWLRLNRSRAAIGGCLQAGRGRLAVGWYRSQAGRWLSSGEAEMTTAEELAQSIHKPSLICGELSSDERQLLAR